MIPKSQALADTEGRRFESREQPYASARGVTTDAVFEMRRPHLTARLLIRLSASLRIRIFYDLCNLPGNVRLMAVRQDFLWFRGFGAFAEIRQWRTNWCLRDGLMSGG
jgi:hypothetical protein